MAVTHAQAVDSRGRRDVGAEQAEHFARAAPHRATVEEAALARKIAEEDIFLDAERQRELEFLMDGLNAERLRLAGGREGDLAAVHLDVPLVGHHDPRQDFHEGRFAGAVFAEQSMNLAGPHLKCPSLTAWTPP